MPIALGFIEADSISAVVEAADKMLKSFDIVLAGKEVLSPGTVTLKIIGGSESVKSALKSAEEEIRKLGKNAAVHIISDPDERLFSILPEMTNFYYHYKKVQPQTAVEKSHHDVLDTQVKKEDLLNITQPEKKSKPEKPEVSKKIKKEKIKIRAKEKADLQETKERIKIPEAKEKMKPPEEEKNKMPANYFRNDTIARLRQEALGFNKPKPNGKEKKEKKKVESTKENIESFNVHKLRKLARGTNDFPIKGRIISKANRDVLLNYFRELKLI